MRLRIVIFVSSLRNPFVEAWLGLLQSISSLGQVSILCSESSLEASDVPMAAAARVVHMKDADGSIVGDWRSRTEGLLGGAPTVLFYWWGIHALKDRRPRLAWPEAKVTLCVDTYPNASMLVSELREIGRGFQLLPFCDSLVTCSEQMYTSLLQNFPFLKHTPYAVVEAPFAMRAHRDRPWITEYRRSQPNLRLCFVGRSDFLFRREKRMAKDDLGSWLSGFISDGISVSVQEPNDQGQRAALKAKGFSFYPSFSRESLSNGSFSAFLSTFNANLVFYSVNNGTIRRRVSNGLSTRFAAAVCASAPIVAPPEAGFAAEFLKRNPIGFCSSTHDQIVTRVREEGESFRENWRKGHHFWAGEAYGDALKSMLT